MTLVKAPLQAPAAMVFGIEGLEPVDMIVGSGNAYVTEAKRQLFGKVGIDLLAGPSEIIVLADGTPEHLEVQTDRDDWYFEQLRNYGSIFIGTRATVAFSDKAIGTNHTLPTGQAARYTGRGDLARGHNARP